MNGQGGFLPYKELMRNFAAAFMSALDNEFLMQCPLCKGEPKKLACDGTTCDRSTDPGTPGVAMCRVNKNIEVANILRYTEERTTAFRPVRQHLDREIATAPVIEGHKCSRRACSYAHAPPGIGGCCAPRRETLVECLHCKKPQYKGQLSHRSCQKRAETFLHARAEQPSCYYCTYRYLLPFAHTEVITDFEDLLDVTEMKAGLAVIKPVLALIEAVAKTLTSLSLVGTAKVSQEREALKGEDGTYDLTAALDNLQFADYNLPSYSLGLLQAAGYIHLRICGVATDKTTLTPHEKTTYAALGSVLCTLVGAHNAFTSVRYSCLHLWVALIAALKGTGTHEAVRWDELRDGCTYPALLLLAQLLLKPQSPETAWLKVPLANLYAGLHHTACEHNEEIISDHNAPEGGSNDAEEKDTAEDITEEDSEDSETEPPPTKTARGSGQVVRRRGKKARKQRFRAATANRPTSLAPLAPLDPTVDGALYHFDADAIPHREGAKYIEDTKPGGVLKCRKFYQATTLGTWGIFLMFCEHSHCYGFHEIIHAEGRRDAFFVLRNLASKPKVVIYDFACQLEAYCMARDPFYFKDVVFLIDRFHHHNHTCCEMYKLSNYPHLSHLNSVVCEQANSDIKGAMQHQGKKMNGPLFYLTLLTQIARWNFSKDATTRRKMEEQDRLDTAAPAVDLTMDQQTG